MSNWNKEQMEQAYNADVKIKERLDVFRKKEDANVAKTTMARRLLGVVHWIFSPYVCC